jgi:hypothetical protein
MTSDRPLPALTLTLILCAPVCAMEPLRHDVFARPTLAALAVQSPDASPSANAPGNWNPRLTAVMVAGKASLATIDGRILAIGESTEGYRLVSVRDSEAILVKADQRIVLTMAAPAPTAIKSRGGQ